MIPARRAQVGDDEIRMLVWPIEFRDGDAAAPVLDGYAAVFNQDTQIGGDQWGWMERIAPGAFAKSIAADDIRSFFNHDANQILGRTSVKTLALVEDEKGLRATIHPPDTAAARDVVALIKRGDVSGMSFMFRTRGEQWIEPTQKGQLPQRTLLDVQLFEVGPVAMPAYPTTSISARDHAKALSESRESAVFKLADADRRRRLRLAQAICIDRSRR